jgi:RHS repeat-associated protein
MVSHYDALGRRTYRDERNNGITDADTVNEYFYDIGVSPAPQVTTTYVLGRLAHVQAPTGKVYFSYDAFGRVNARTFTDTNTSMYVEKSSFRGDGALYNLEFYLPDTGFNRELVEYGYDTAARLREIKFIDGSAATRHLYEVSDIDPFGRVRRASFGGATDYQAGYADVGRRLMNGVKAASPLGSRFIRYLGYDPLGREMSRHEIKDNTAPGIKTNVAYDRLGRLSSAVKTDGTTALSSWLYEYDALGNLVALKDLVDATRDATISFRPSDLDRVCRIGYGSGGLGGTTCNVDYDGVGNIVDEHTRTGQRGFKYFGSGRVRSIVEGAANATFRYDPFGAVQELNLTGAGVSDARHDRRYGPLIERRDEEVNGTTTTFISRNIPGPGGVVASRRGTGNEWVFGFGEQRGSRFFTDVNGAFVQDIDYEPYGEAKSSIQPGSPQYSNVQWNGGDALAAFGLSYLGARLYDPVIGRFLSRDPLVVPRTAATTNAYAFAMNDPLNRSDPTGLDCYGPECQGEGPTNPDPGGGGPSGTNPPCLYLSCAPGPGGPSNPHAADRSPPNVLMLTIPAGSDVDLSGLKNPFYDPDPPSCDKLGGSGVCRVPPLPEPPWYEKVSLTTALLIAYERWDSPSKYAIEAALMATGLGELDAGITAAGGFTEIAGADTVGLTARSTSVAVAGGIDAATTEAAEDAAGLTLYRGVASDSPGFANALKGIANPIGGDASAVEHSLGNTASNFTSWTSDYDTALKFATNGGTTNGAVLTNTFAPGVAVPVAPNIEELMMESEHLVTGPTSGALVTLIPHP